MVPTDKDWENLIDSTRPMTVKEAMDFEDNVLKDAPTGLTWRWRRVRTGEIVEFGHNPDYKEKKK